MEIINSELRRDFEKLPADWLTKQFPQLRLPRLHPSELDHCSLLHSWIWYNARLSILFGFVTSAGQRLLEAELLLKRLAEIRFASFEELIHQDAQVGISLLCMDLCLSAKHAEEELQKRLEARDIGTALFLRDLQPEALGKVLRVDRISSYRPWRQEKKDIQHSGILLALEIYKKLGTTMREQRPLPPVPQCDNPKEAEALRSLRATYGDVVAKLTAEILPILEGNTEAIRGKVRDAQREVWRKLKRQKTVPGNLDRFPADNDMEDALERASAYRFFQKRWGERATAFLKAKFLGKTVEESAAEAGICRDTAQKYLRVFKEVIRKKV